MPPGGVTEEVTSIQRELSTLCAVLGRIEGLSNSCFGLEASFPEGLSGDLKISLDDCMEVFIALESLLQAVISSGQSKPARLKHWIKKSKDISKAKQALEARKANLNIIFLLLMNLSITELAKSNRRIEVTTEAIRHEFIGLVNAFDDGDVSIQAEAGSAKLDRSNFILRRFISVKSECSSVAEGVDSLEKRLWESFGVGRAQTSLGPKVSASSLSKSSLSRGHNGEGWSPWRKDFIRIDEEETAIDSSSVLISDGVSHVVTASGHARQKNATAFNDICHIISDDVDIEPLYDSEPDFGVTIESDTGSNSKLDLPLFADGSEQNGRIPNNETAESEVNKDDKRENQSSYSLSQGPSDPPQVLHRKDSRSIRDVQSAPKPLRSLPRIKRTEHSRRPLRQSKSDVDISRANLLQPATQSLPSMADQLEENTPRTTIFMKAHVDREVLQEFGLQYYEKERSIVVSGDIDVQLRLQLLERTNDLRKKSEIFRARVQLIKNVFLTTQGVALHSPWSKVALPPLLDRAATRLSL